MTHGVEQVVVSGKMKVAVPMMKIVEDLKSGALAVGKIIRKKGTEFIDFLKLQSALDVRSPQLKETYGFDRKFSSLAFGLEYKAYQVLEKVDALSKEVKGPFFEAAKAKATEYAQGLSTTVRGRLAEMRGGASRPKLSGPSPCL